MPLSFGIPIGILLALAGLVLYSASKWKRLARSLVSVGIAVLLFTILAIVLAANSSM